MAFELNVLTGLLIALLTPVVTELVTAHRAGGDPSTKPTKRLVASVVAAAAIGVDVFLIRKVSMPLEDLLMQFVFVRALVEGGHVTVDGVLKRAGVDLDRSLAPKFGV